jgi:sterol desaturase/sphingolipid hydroxylase (fatty acid hydroxylase superfamily)
MAPERPIALRLLDLVSVIGFAAVTGALAIRLLSVPWDASHLLHIVLGAGVGYIAADIVSGVVHWFCDTFFHEDTPIIGRAFIHPFREHHVDPLAITRHDFLEVNGNNCLAMLPLLVAVLILGSPPVGEAVPALFWQSAALGFALATFATNQFHKWAHQERPSAAVRWLQGTGVVLSPAHHKLHHSAPYRQAFCITAGWLDPLLDRYRIFERIERLAREGRSGTNKKMGPSPLRPRHGSRRKMDPSPFR